MVYGKDNGIYGQQSVKGHPPFADIVHRSRRQKYANGPTRLSEDEACPIIGEPIFRYLIIHLLCFPFQYAGKITAFLFCHQTIGNQPANDIDQYRKILGKTSQIV